MNLCIKVVWEVFRVILSCMSTDKFSKKSYTCKLRKTFLWSVVGWRKLCLKFLFITKVVLKIFLYFLFKKYAKIMCINYKIQNYTLWRRKLSKKKKLMCCRRSLATRPPDERPRIRMPAKRRRWERIWFSERSMNPIPSAASGSPLLPWTEVQTAAAATAAAWVEGG